MEEASQMKNNKTPQPYQHPSLKGINYVIFPRDKWIQHWDNLFLTVLLYYCFAIPYSIGVSGGYFMYQSVWWFVFNFILNLIYIADLCMHFFRAYYDANGILVYELRKIAKNYFFSVGFVLNLIAAFPIQLVLYVLYRKYYEGEEIKEHAAYSLLGIMQILRLLRINRVDSLTKSSVAIQSWWERQNIPRALLGLFMLKLIVVVHWVACFWSFLALAQAGTFGDNLSQEPNWISYWYNGYYVDGGINPYGWDQSLGRYALSLFWSIQSVTSIGYGNIVPATSLEYYFANILMLLSGIFWAFTIGSILEIVQHMNQNQTLYKRHMDVANIMISTFSPSNVDNSTLDKQSDIGVGDPDVVATRIRKFITAQYDGTMLSVAAGSTSPTLDQIFPTLDTLSLEIRQLSSLHLMRKYFDMVPYLSHKYLTPEEQSDLAFKCIFLEFSRLETFVKHPQYGRGIIIIKKGYGLSIGCHGIMGVHSASDNAPIAVNEILVEESFLADDQPLYRFTSYALVIFIPRSVICEVLKANKKAWKDCARWIYLKTCLLKWARKKNDV